MANDKSSEVSESAAPSSEQTTVERHDKPVHVATDSLLSHSSGFNNYRGFLNLCIVLLGMSASRLVLENLIKYGILMDPVMWFTIFLQDPYSWPNLSLIIFLNFFILLAFWIEKLAAMNLIGPQLTKGLVTLNIMTVFTFPVVVILYCKPIPLGSFASLGTYTIVFLKLISYAAVNKWCRAALSESVVEPRSSGNASQPVRRSPRRHSTPQQGPRKRFSTRRRSEGSDTHVNGNVISDHGDDTAHSLVTYPNNLTLKDMYYFMMVPTLCYELNFPRTQRIRKRFLIRRIIEVIFLVQLCLCLCQQWMVPTVMNGMVPFNTMDFKRMIERILKLAVPNHIVWLCFFYVFFHSWLNILGEVARFGDRQFYKDWWNAQTIGYFWRNWNIPVHRWCVRHLYIPLCSNGWSQRQAQIVVFLVSAIFHEYLVSIPLQMFRLWAFWGMVAQLPLGLLTSRVKGQWGNILVWISLIIGQPIAIFLYFHDYFVLQATSNVNATSP